MADAADRLVLTDGRSQEGEILSVDGSNVQIAVGAGTIGIPLGRIQSVEKRPPEGYEEGIAAYRAGETGKALGLLRPLAEGFAGLPVDWARQATSVLGDLLLNEGDLDGAEKAFRKYQEAYGADGGGGVTLAVGLARIELARGEAEAAAERIRPVIDEAMAKPGASGPAGSAYGHAFLIAGKLAEERGDHAKALEHYLRTETVFHSDERAVELAMESRRSLTARHPELIVP